MRKSKNISKICGNFAPVNTECKISVVINTYNAEQHLERVLDSVKDFDEVLVCDMESTDHTVEIARNHGCRVLTFPKGEHRIAEPAREFAIKKATYEWVLVIDADELVTPQLRNYLYEMAAKPDCPAGIAIPRKNYFMGHFLHSAYPDYVLRFFMRDKAHWPPVIHSSPEVDGTVMRIGRRHKELALEHLANDSVSDILRKTDNYSNYELSRRRHKNYGLMHLLFRPFFRFMKSYVLKCGFLDGKAGFIHALLDGIYQTAIVSKLIEERESKRIE